MEVNNPSLLALPDAVVGAICGRLDGVSLAMLEATSSFFSTRQPSGLVLTEDCARTALLTQCGSLEVADRFRQARDGAGDWGRGLERMRTVRPWWLGERRPRITPVTLLFGLCESIRGVGHPGERFAGRQGGTPLPPTPAARRRHPPSPYPLPVC